MLGFFSGKKAPAEPLVIPVMAELQDKEQRWFVFLEKLEASLVELAEGAEIEGMILWREDTDPYKRTYLNFARGIKGQFETVYNKARDVCDTQIHGAFDHFSHNPYDSVKQYDLYNAHSDLVYQFRSSCMDRYNEWEERLRRREEQLFSQIEGQESLEAKYQAVLQEYQSSKNAFACKQCGGGITIEKIFSISTYVTCPYCQTQNTFNPGSQAAMLMHIARPLAEERQLGKYQEYAALKSAEEVHFRAFHRAELDAVSGSQQHSNGVKALYEQYKQARSATDDSYGRYLRAVFDEMHGIIPDLAEANEKVFESRLKDYRRDRN